jgi:hypothetical protein
VAVRTAHAARQTYIGLLQRALSAFAANAILVRSGHDSALGAEGLTLANGDPMPLRTGRGEAHLALAIRLHYRTVEAPGTLRQWIVQPASYSHKLEDAANPRHEILRYDWHPQIPGVAFSHVHVPEAMGTITGRTHIPTGFVTLQDVVAFAIRDLGVVPLAARADWRIRLQHAGEALEASLTWTHPRAL